MHKLLHQHSFFRDKSAAQYQSANEQLITGIKKTGALRESIILIQKLCLLNTSFRGYLGIQSYVMFTLKLSIIFPRSPVQTDMTLL